MREMEWKHIDKSSWKRGEWDNEPDKAQWTDKATGLPCLVVRGPGGHWCGYVGVTDGHPWFQKDYDACRINGDDWPSVHGGLTFASLCAPDDKETGICHIVEPGENDRVWWLGFDCAHSGDLSPKHERSFALSSGETYRTLAYVRGECARLASQARGVTDTFDLRKRAETAEDKLRECAEIALRISGASVRVCGGATHPNDVPSLIDDVMTLMKRVHGDEIRKVLEQACGDVCMYCGGRAPTHFRTPRGPNSAGNYTHEPINGGLLDVLCTATGIRSRARM